MLPMADASDIKNGEAKMMLGFIVRRCATDIGHVPTPDELLVGRTGSTSAANAIACLAKKSPPRRQRSCSVSPDDWLPSAPKVSRAFGKSTAHERRRRSRAGRLVESSQYQPLLQGKLDATVFCRHGTCLLDSSRIVILRPTIMFVNRVFRRGVTVRSWLYWIAAAAPVFPLFLSVQALAQTKLDKVRIGYAARAVAHSVPFVAKEAGFFAEEGIDAEIVRTAGPIAPMALVANEVDLAIMSAYLMIPVATQNKDVVMLGGFSRYASMVFVARPDVKSAQDLKGKIVGIQRPGDAYEKSARFALRHLGLDADKDIKMLSLGSNDVMWSALQTGRVARRPSCRRPDCARYGQTRQGDQRLGILPGDRRVHQRIVEFAAAGDGAPEAAGGITQLVEVHAAQAVGQFEPAGVPDCARPARGDRR